MYEIWSDQHLGILNLISDSSSVELEQLKLTETQHRKILLWIWEKLAEVEAITDRQHLYNGWLLVWRESLNRLTNFGDFNLFIPRATVNQKKDSFSLISLSNLSGEGKFRLVMIVAFVIAIIIATLLLLKK